MGRKYEGLDARKVTIRLDADMEATLTRYTERTGHSMSDAIREALHVFSDYIDLSDTIRYVICNLEAVAETFDKIDGPTAPKYAGAVRDGVALLSIFCDGIDIEWRFAEDGERKEGEKWGACRLEKEETPSEN